jgi:hypothetical protein
VDRGQRKNPIPDRLNIGQEPHNASSSLSTTDPRGDAPLVPHAQYAAPNQREARALRQRQINDVIEQLLALLA